MIADQRHRKSIEPKLTITHEIRDSESTTPLFVVYVVDKDNMIKRPYIEEVS